MTRTKETTQRTGAVTWHISASQNSLGTANMTLVSLSTHGPMQYLLYCWTQTLSCIFLLAKNCWVWPPGSLL